MKERLSKNIRKQMIYMMLNETVRIILPKWIWDNATNNDEFKRNLARYMKRYHNYRVTKVGKYYAICVIER